MWLSAAPQSAGSYRVSLHHQSARRPRAMTHHRARRSSPPSPDSGRRTQPPTHHPRDRCDGKGRFSDLQQRAREHATSHFEGCTAVDLVTKPSADGTGRTCVGVYVLVQASGRVSDSLTLSLSTGGASAYLYTSLTERAATASPWPARRLPGCESRVQSIPSHLSVSPACEIVSDY